MNGSPAKDSRCTILTAGTAGPTTLRNYAAGQAGSAWCISRRAEPQCRVI